MTTRIETEAKIELMKDKFENLKLFTGKIVTELYQWLDPWKPKEDQINTFYRNGKDILRVRESSYFRNGSLRYKSVFLTCKTPSEDSSKYKSNNEKEIQFSSDYKRQILSVLDLLNLKQFFSYRKFRTDCNLENCVVSFDEIPDYSRYFIEIEGEEKDISKVIGKLGLQDKQTEKRSYLEILSGDKYGMH